MVASWVQRKAVQWDFQRADKRVEMTAVSTGWIVAGGWAAQ